MNTLRVTSMSDAVKRDYRSELRAAQAQETRRSIVSAATRLFVEDGYGSTTINAVAEAAGVSRKTVFNAVGGKLDLLKLALDWSVAGDDEAVALSDRAAIRKLMDQPDARGVLTGLVALVVAISARVAHLYEALEASASMDPAARDLVAESQRRRLDDAHKVVRHLRDLDALTTHITEQEAVDVVWLAMDPAIFDRLVRLRGWTPGRFEEWLADTLCRQLLG
jgi:AcrR family transcriptional regulator